MSVAAQSPASAPRTPILSVSNIEVIYDHVILVLKGVSLEVPEGGIVALIDAKGGATPATPHAISNLLHVGHGAVTKGTIEYRRACRLRRWASFRSGCCFCQVMEGRHCFAHL